MLKEENNLLVKKFLDGDESAFNELVRKHQKNIYWHARRLLGNHMDADEVTQEVIITMYKKLNTFKFDSAVTTWLYKITYNKSVNNIRKSKVRKYLFLDDEEVREMKNSENLYEDYESKEKLNKVDEVLNELPIKQKEVFILKQFEGLKYREIAEITGKSEGALKANYFHALKKVTELINEK
ncbi:MAG: RNA polymerase sigma factor [Ignavibacteriae bacterium]|nr:RNA polymerase sigma factor [Ignavibacteriota bacterium]NOG96769.1 RNA polymerase sigma factor [Ignavibacteriota bacterium]